MHAGTSCGRCLWRRSGGPPQTFCSATRSSRASSDAHGPPPVPVRPPWPRRLPSTPACPVPRTPPTILLPPGSRAQCRSNLLPCLPITSVCLVRTTHQVAQPSHREARLIASDRRDLRGVAVLFPQKGSDKKALSSLASFRLLSLNKSRKSDPSLRAVTSQAFRVFIFIYCRRTVSRFG